MEMKKNNDFVLRRIADSSVLVPFGSKAINFNGVITLNDSAEFLWKNISWIEKRRKISEERA